MQYTHRKLQRSVTEMRRSATGRDRVSTTGPGAIGASIARRTSCPRASRTSVNGMNVAIALSTSRNLSRAWVYDPRALAAAPQDKTMLPEYLSVDVVMERIA